MSVHSGIGQQIDGTGLGPKDTMESKNWHSLLSQNLPYNKGGKKTHPDHITILLTVLLQTE